MFGRIIGAIVGAKAARRRGGINEPSGALMGVAAVTLARRFGIPGIIAATVGGYALKRHNERRRSKVTR
jgi:hypothetical protein